LREENQYRAAKCRLIPFVAHLPQAVLAWQFRSQIGDFIREPAGLKVKFEWKQQTADDDFAQDHSYFFSSFPSPKNLSSTVLINCVPFTNPKKISNPRKRRLVASASEEELQR